MYIRDALITTGRFLGTAYSQHLGFPHQAANSPQQKEGRQNKKTGTQPLNHCSYERFHPSQFDKIKDYRPAKSRARACRNPLNLGGGGGDLNGRTTTPQRKLQRGHNCPKKLFFIGSNLSSRAACLHLGPGSGGTGLTEDDKPWRSAGHVTTAASAQPLAGSGSLSPDPGGSTEGPGARQTRGKGGRGHRRRPP